MISHLFNNWRIILLLFILIWNSNENTNDFNVWVTKFYYYSIIWSDEFTRQRQSVLLILCLLFPVRSTLYVDYYKKYYLIPESFSRLFDNLIYKVVILKLVHNSKISNNLIKRGKTVLIGLPVFTSTLACFILYEWTLFFSSEVNVSNGHEA